MSELITYLKRAVEDQASDLFFVAGGTVSQKLDGHLRPIGEGKLLPPDTERLITEIYEIGKRSMETFLESDLLPFASFPAGQGTTAIMVSHNIVNCWDEEMPASLSAEVHRFMREEFGFDGIIMTDALDMGAVKAYTNGGNIAVTALQAGNDILLVCDYKTGIPAILEAVADGTLSEDVIDTACRRVLTWKQSLGLI